ncbi:MULTISPECIES: EAL domain-containing protein [unclassified Roseateles]|uniref:EAL domain-containing protein n=1 Tax=unclassified Roseateles TaxID=2626991 RepID=UPI0016180614|nr:EAL domain-containing protein [Mitsuaria sp. BK037]MBB3280819.1 c-di-GMP-related signal transduction protein [Mitsuaria sp. BK037]
MPSSRPSRSGVTLVQRLMAPQPPQVHFARQAVIDGSVEPMGLELAFRWKEGQRRPPRPPSPGATSLLLSRALLDGGLIQQRRPGCLFVDMDAAALLSPVADVLCGALGAIQLPTDVPVQASTTRRIAQLHARGYQFALAGIASPDDPRLAWLPMVAFLKLDVSLAPLDAWAPIQDLARQAGVALIADRLTEPADYLRLKARGVRYFQGDLLGPPQEESPRALPSCDLDVLARLFRLARLGAPHDALAMAAAADPALVVRLLMLHRLYLNRLRPPASLTEALADLPEQVLIGWLHVLRTSTFDLSPHTRSWSQAVREQIHNYRARLIGARACSSPAELEAKVFDLYRRLCSRESIPPPTRPTLLERCGPF